LPSASRLFVAAREIRAKILKVQEGEEGEASDGPNERNRGRGFTVSFEAALNADEVEEACLAGVRASSEAGLLDERISGATSDEPAGSQVERSERETLTNDVAAGRRGRRAAAACGNARWRVSVQL